MKKYSLSLLLLLVAFSTSCSSDNEDMLNKPTAKTGKKTDNDKKGTVENDNTCFSFDPKFVGAGKFVFNDQNPNSICKKGTKSDSLISSTGSECRGVVGPGTEKPTVKSGTIQPIFSDPNADYNCNGQADSEEDLDNDGVTKGDGDCCDDPYTCTAVRSTSTFTPEALLEAAKEVHPGAFEYADDGLDNDCVGGDKKSIHRDIVSDYKPGTCQHLSVSKRLNNAKYFDLENNDATMPAAIELARAMDINLPVVTEDSGNAGIVEAKIYTMDYRYVPKPQQINVMCGAGLTPFLGKTKYYIAPRANDTFAIISTGIANDRRTKTILPIEETVDNQTSMRYPSKAFLNTDGAKYKTDEPLYNFALKHARKLPSSSKCKGSKVPDEVDPDLKDTVHFKLILRAPKHAHGFKFKFRFFTQEYPDSLCNEYNDFFLTLLTPLDNNKIEALPEDRNISFDSNHDPISVNNAFFTSCAPTTCTHKSDNPPNKNQKPACGYILTCGKKEEGKNKEDKKDSYHSCTDKDNGCVCMPWGESETNITGPACSDGTEGENAVKTFFGSKGGGTSWLSSEAPVKGGSLFRLDFYIWDAHNFEKDSHVILDDFQWLYNKTEIKTERVDPPELG